MKLESASGATTGGPEPDCASAPIPLFKVFMPETVVPALSSTLFSGYVAEGPRVKEFESGLAQWTGTPRIVALNSGTSALHLALKLAGVEPGDEVISTPMTCIATNLPILHLGARVVWSDVDPDTGNVDPESMRKLVTQRTRAIMVVHWAGYPCDLDAVHAIASQHELPVIEDACHAFGATYHGQAIGCHSDYVCFSFQAIKALTTGDGGALTCQTDSDLRQARLLRWYGMDHGLGRVNAMITQDVIDAGYKYHMNDIAATIGLEQLKFVADNLARAAANAQRYMDAFSGQEHVRVMKYQPDRSSSWWQFTVRVRDREHFRKAMLRKAIVASPLQRRNDIYSVFRQSARELPGVDAFDREHICIPVGSWVGENEVKRVIDAVSRYKP